MLLPRFTIRTGLAALTGGVLLAIVVRSALAGEAWAIGVTTAVCAIGLSVALQALAFAASLVLSRGETAPTPRRRFAVASPLDAPSTEAS